MCRSRSVFPTGTRGDVPGPAAGPTPHPARRASRTPWRTLAGVVAGVLLLGCTSPVTPGAPLRVGTSGDYAPFSTVTEDGARSGLDVDLAQRFAAAHGRRIAWVPFRWPELLADLEAGRFDVAMSGVTVRPERSLAGRFTVPVTRNGAVVLVRASSPADHPRALDRKGVRIAVNAGGHLERVARANLARATIEPVPDNEGVIGRLVDGSVDAVVTDTLEAPHWERVAEAQGVLTHRLGPFTRDRKAWLVRADRPGLARELSAFLLAEEASGRLEEARAAHGAGVSRTATPLAALEAAVDERLGLMPFVAEAKRGTGVPIHVPEREQAVLDAAWARTRDAADERGVAPPPRERVDAFFRAQIRAAREIQEATLARAAARGPASSLDTALRPALLRLGDQIAWLLVAALATRDPADATALGAWGAGIAAPGLSDAARAGIAQALRTLVGTETPALPLPAARGPQGASELRAPRRASAGSPHGRRRARAPRGARTDRRSPRS